MGGRVLEHPAARAAQPEEQRRERRPQHCLAWRLAAAAVVLGLELAVRLCQGQPLALLQGPETALQAPWRVLFLREGAQPAVKLRKVGDPFGKLLVLCCLL